MEELLLYLSLLYKGDYQQITNGLKKDIQIDYEQLNKWKTELKCNYITILDNEYPHSLRHLVKPPYVLYYYGDINLLKMPRIAVIGTRQPTSTGISNTKRITKELIAANYCIVSGLALGVDCIAARQCFDKGKTIAVLGCGIDYCYPKENYAEYSEIKRNHLLISEYPNLTAPLKYMFPWRNRIIAGIADIILVTEAKSRSGTLITVGHGLDLGKEIYAVMDDNNGYNGCSELIELGATGVVNGLEIIENEELSKF